MSVKESTAVWRNPIHFLAFGFGSGLIKPAPGTWGTVAAIPLYLLIQEVPLIVYSGLLLLAIVFGIWICHVTEKALGVPDHSGIVWDEICGYLLTMWAIPSGWLWLALGFILFRIFDIIKPWPIRLIDRHIKGGLGIMLDDLLAAIPAWLILQLFIKLST